MLYYILYICYIILYLFLYVLNFFIFWSIFHQLILLIYFIVYNFIGCLYIGLSLIFIYLSIATFICLVIHLFLCLFNYLFICLLIHFCVYPILYISVSNQSFTFCDILHYVKIFATHFSKSISDIYFLSPSLPQNLNSSQKWILVDDILLLLSSSTSFF